MESTTSNFAALLDPLEKLDDLDTIYVRQPVRKMEMFLEMCCGWNVKNKYEVGSWNGEEESEFQPLFVLEEESNCLLRQCCQQARPLELNAFQESRHPNQEDHPLFSIVRPLRMQCCCISAKSGCLGRDYMEILTCNGALMGDVSTIKNYCCTCDTGFSFLVSDADGKEVCELIRNNCCVCSCGKDVEFQIFIDGVDTGCLISKTYGGIIKEIFTD